MWDRLHRKWDSLLKICPVFPVRNHGVVIPDELVSWVDDGMIRSSRPLRVHDSLRHISGPPIASYSLRDGLANSDGKLPGVK